MTRLPGIAPSSLTPAQQAVYAAIASGPRAAGSAFPLVDDDGALVGPFNAMLLQPELGDALQALGGAVRYATAMSARAREIAILVVAHLQKSDFERYAHEAVGLRAGLSAAELTALASGEVSVFADPVEHLVAATVTALVSRADLTDAEFTAARDGLGLAGLFELTTLVGYYRTLALQLRVFRVPTPGSPA